MNKREIKAYVHRNRIGDVVGALSAAGFSNLSVVDVQGLLQALDKKEQQYSVEIGQKVITEVKLELVCEDESRTAEAVSLIREHGKTGQPEAGWIYVTEIRESFEIGN
ncbi:MAG: P-II family nitrogen regulator [Gammaproteobacteria bacterium]|nr:P-II family nitrogen regulator [Gammaproteobacteria bacterium]